MASTYLTSAELSTHLYGEVTQEINRGSDTKNSDTAIEAAIEQARGYVTSYDTAAIFNATGTARNAALLMYVKDIAVWHFIQLANPSVDMELREKRYDSAIRELEKIQSGKSNPNLPYPALAEGAPLPETSITFGSIPKRVNNF